MYSTVGEDEEVVRGLRIGGTLAALVGSNTSGQTVKQAVLDTLRNAILSGDLPVNTRLGQAEVAESLNVSTTPVREALRHLETEGLVRVDTHRGAVVRSLSRKDLEELFEIRIMLEPEVLRRAMPIPTDVLQAAEEIHEQIKSEVAPWRYPLLNREFHLTLYRATDLPRLVSILEGLMNQLMVYVSASLRADPQQMERSIREHALLLDAMRRNDVDAAIALQIEHIAIPTVALSFQATDH